MQTSIADIIRPHHSKFARLRQLIDGVGVAGALWVSCRVFGISWDSHLSTVAVLAMGSFFFFAETKDLYRSWRGASLRQEALRVWNAWMRSMLALIFLTYVFKISSAYPRQVILFWFISTPVTLTAWRFGLRLFLHGLRRRGHNSRTVAIAGAGDLGLRLSQTILDAPWMGMPLVGFYDDNKPRGHRPLASELMRVEGDLDELAMKAQKGEIDLVYITLPLRAEARIKELVTKLADSTASVYVVPDFFVFDLLHARWMNLGDISAVSVFETPFFGMDGWTKRLIDLVLSSVILLMIAVPMALIAIGVKLSSPGPVIFRQRRYGLDGREIEVWKFRTMTVCEDGTDMRQATKNDARITRFGRFLRRTSLDEFPQFINVLQGRMSIVGPRPHPIALNEKYRELIHGYMLRHKVKPGITGWAQINGWRGETKTLEKMQKRIEYDLEYIRHWSLWLDLKIIFLTALKGFSGENAY